MSVNKWAHQKPALKTYKKYRSENTVNEENVFYFSVSNFKSHIVQRLKNKPVLSPQLFLRVIQQVLH